MSINYNRIFFYFKNRIGAGQLKFSKYSFWTQTIFVFFKTSNFNSILYIREYNTLTIFFIFNNKYYGSTILQKKDGKKRNKTKNKKTNENLMDTFKG